MEDRYSRRDILRHTPGAVALAIAAVSVVPRAVQAQQKVAKATVQYQDTPKGAQQCSGCSNFVAPGSCRVVAGTISPHGWCSIWTPK